MSDFALAPYFHPTTICILDDNESFLRSLDLELPGSWAFRTFSDPKIALEFLSQPCTLPPLMDRCFSMQIQAGSHAVIDLDLGLIEQEINYVERFNRNAVVLVDYSMPDMNGLQFCRELEDPFIRKALLTGVADEKVAVEAFNAGLIHRYIPKHVQDPIEVIKAFVVDMQQEYFSQYTARLKTTLAINPPRFLIEPAIARYVHKLMRREHLIEYYLVNDPPGLLLLNSAGRLWRLALMTADQARQQAEFARAGGAPGPVVDRLARGRSLGFFCGSDPDDEFSAEGYPWRDLVFPAQTLTGSNDTWHVAVWKDAVADIDFDPASASYDAYCRTL